MVDHHLVLEAVPVHGRITLTVVDHDWWAAHRHDVQAMLHPPVHAVQQRRAGRNVMCTTGFTALAAALVWSGIQDQASNLGLTSSTYLTPLYGAIGTGAGTAAKSDTALFTEFSRTTVGGGASVPATASVAAEATWLFYFPQFSNPETITEAGLFANATSTAGSGSMIDHWVFSPTISLPNTSTLILQVSLGFGP